MKILFFILIITFSISIFLATDFVFACTTATCTFNSCFGLPFCNNLCPVSWLGGSSNCDGGSCAFTGYNFLFDETGCIIFDPSGQNSCTQAGSQCISSGCNYGRGGRCPDPGTTGTSSCLTSNKGANYYNGAKCEIRWGLACENGVSGKWDTSDKICMACDGKTEGQCFANTYNIFTKIMTIAPVLCENYGKCESACGADGLCDEKAPGYTFPDECTSSYVKYTSCNSACQYSSTTYYCDETYCGNQITCGGITSYCYHQFLQNI